MLKNFVRYFLSSLEYLTIIKLSKKDVIWEEGELGRFPGYFPLVGLTIGLILFLAWYLLTLVLPIRISALIVVLLLVVLNRGFHLDGLADTADGLFSHRSKERMLEIMRDSSQGTFGVLAIVFDIFLKVELITLMADFPVGIILFPVWGRLAVSVVAVKSSHLRPEGGLGAFVVTGSRWPDLALAVFCSFLLSFLFAQFLGVIIFLLLIAFGFLLTKIWHKSLGGVTGDLLGASVELGEIFSLFLLAIFLKFNIFTF